MEEAIHMNPVDRISELPESLISHILSTLPTKDAVATSILARSWRFRWTKITSFYFFEDTGKSSENQIHGDDAVQAMDFVDFINNTVTLNHSGDSINRFILKWASSKFPNLPLFLNKWVDIAIARNARLLRLIDLNAFHRTVANFEIDLPSSLYTSRTLEVLRLVGPFKVKPPKAVYLPKLAKLELSHVMYGSDESLRYLISGCHVLEYLEVLRRGIDNLVVCSISSPTLKHLVFIYTNPVPVNVDEDMKLEINTPALENLTLLNYMSDHISIKPRLKLVNRVILDTSNDVTRTEVVELLQACSAAKALTLQSGVMGVLRMDTLPLNVNFERLTKLVSPLQWSFVRNLLDGCTNLEHLDISDFGRASFGDPWKNPACVPRCLLSSLKRLKFRRFDGDEEEMAMLKWFLDHGLVMERVDIWCDGQCPIDYAKRFKLVSKVSELARASPACKISWREGVCICLHRRCKTV